jgi:hypothetical protein
MSGQEIGFTQIVRITGSATLEVAVIIGKLSVILLNVDFSMAVMALLALADPVPMLLKKSMRCTIT